MSSRCWLDTVHLTQVQSSQDSVEPQVDPETQVTVVEGRPPEDLHHVEAALSKMIG